jgi:hypothetical protein
MTYSMNTHNWETSWKNHDTNGWWLLKIEERQKKEEAMYMDDTQEG